MTDSSVIRAKLQQLAIAKQRKKELTKETTKVNGEIRALEQIVIEHMASLGTTTLKGDLGRFTLKSTTRVGLEIEGGRATGEERRHAIEVLQRHGYDEVVNLNYSSLTSVFKDADESNTDPEILKLLRKSTQDSITYSPGPGVFDE